MAVAGRIAVAVPRFQVLLVVRCPLVPIDSFSVNDIPVKVYLLSELFQEVHRYFVLAVVFVDYRQVFPAGFEEIAD